MIVITSHAALSEDGRLYLGYGAAAEATKRIPDVEMQCGKQVQAHASQGVYGFLPILQPRPEKRLVGFGLFQAQYSWDDPPDRELIKFSMDGLRDYARTHADVKVRMNFPFPNSRGVTPDTIASLFIPLPETVTICHRGEITRSHPENFLGFKTLYMEIERMLLSGDHDHAVEYLMRNGFDIQSAFEQVNAVQRCIHERRDREAEHVREWRKSKT
jgi:hypothetical protein